MPHFERDHSKPSFWKIVTAKIPGPLKKMIFEEAKKEAEGKVKLTQMKVFSEGDLTTSVMDIAKRMLVEALKLFNGEISSFNKNYKDQRIVTLVCSFLCLLEMCWVLETAGLFSNSVRSACESRCNHHLVSNETRYYESHSYLYILSNIANSYF